MYGAKTVEAGTVNGLQEDRIRRGVRFGREKPSLRKQL